MKAGVRCPGIHLRAPLLLVLSSIVTAGLSAAVQKPAARTLNFDGHTRAYQLLIPGQTASGAVPLIVLLHGRGGNGQRPMSAWQDLARDQGIALVAPNSLAEGWALLQGDGPDFFQTLIEAVKKEAAIDDRRVYLFGHSSGGHQALALGPLESEYFAAVAVHAGALNPTERVFLQQAHRSLEFPITFIEIASHTHDYYSRSSRTNAEAWAFLKAHALSAAPLYRPYTFKR